MHTPLRPSTAPLRRLARTLSHFSSCLAAGWICALASAQPAATPAAAANVDPWWRHAVIYEIYPRSFQDSNGDGLGDLNGIAQRLDYLEALGVDAIWIAPMYPSPQVDFGYDISDYEAVDPQYGTLADFDRLLAQASAHHIRIILDMVLNHTSDRHPWFLEAARARDTPHHDFYVWNDGKTDAAGKSLPPNNWVSLFGGSAWQYVPAVEQFYYHKFYRQQPDLNWRNPAGRAGDVRRDAFLARARRRGLSPRRHHDAVRGRAAARRAAARRSQRAGRPQSERRVHEQSPRGARRHAAHARHDRQLSPASGC